MYLVGTTEAAYIKKIFGLLSCQIVPPSNAIKYDFSIVTGAVYMIIKTIIIS